MNEEQQIRKVIRQVIQKELDEATTTANAPGYQTPFAFGDKDDEKREDDIEDFLDTYDYELAELVKKIRENELSEKEREELEDYIDQVRSMRSGDVEGYKKKSNYYPHNIKENFTEKQLEKWAKEGAPEDLDVAVETPSGEKMDIGKYLEKAIRNEASDEQISNPTIIRTPRHQVKVFSRNGTLKMQILDTKGDVVARITLGKKYGQELLDALTYHL